MLVAIHKLQLAVKNFFRPNLGQTEADQHNFHTKGKVKFVFKNKQIFCLSHEKAACKHVDEIDAWWQRLAADLSKF